MLIVVPVSLFLIVKGLYPAGGHDYYTHYFSFYRAVTETGSILPNEVWYHFYYSKGAGLFFLSMLLTDPLAPQLAASALMLAGAGVMFSLLQSATDKRLLPWLGVALYFAFFIYTPGPHKNLIQGGWGDLEKIHESASMLMFALVWLVFLLKQSDAKRAIGVTLIMTISGMVLISPAMTVFACAYLTLMTAYFFFKKQKDSVLWMCIALVVAGVLFCMLWLINYMVTGLPDDQALLIFWPYIRFDVIKQWGVLSELIYLYLGRIGMANDQTTISHSFPLLVKYLRLDVWGWLLSIAVFSLGVHYFWRKKKTDSLAPEHKSALTIFLLFLLLMSVLFVIGGRAQPISFYRFTTFSYAPMLCFSLLLLATVLRVHILSAIFILLVLVCGVWQVDLKTISKNSAGNIAPHHLVSILKNSLQFATGRYSIAEAYSHQEGWPGRLPWGGIYPGIIEAWKRVPPKTPIWSMHIHSYCMLPDCHMQGFGTHRFTYHPWEVYYGDPRLAKKYLQQENRNYFFVSHQLFIVDILPSTPLFSPDHIAEHLGIVWTDGDNALLTWKENAKQPIDSAWVARYRRQIRVSLKEKTIPYQSLGIYLKRFAEQEKHMVGKVQP